MFQTLLKMVELKLDEDDLYQKVHEFAWNFYRTKNIFLIERGLVLQGQNGFWIKTNTFFFHKHVIDEIGKEKPNLSKPKYGGQSIFFSHVALSINIQVSILYAPAMSFVDSRFAIYALVSDPKGAK